MRNPTRLALPGHLRRKSPGGIFVSRVFHLALLIALALFCRVPAAEGGQVQVFLPGGSGIFVKQVQSLKERRMESVIPQSLDYSCGAAAVATLLNYHFGHEVTEVDALQGMFEHGDQEGIRKRGFSMLDMKRYAEARGLQVEGFKVEDLDTLKKLEIPVITLVDTALYKHFVVIRGVDDRFVYVADPSWGNRRLLREDFQKNWNQVILVLAGPVRGNPTGLYCETEDPRVPKDLIIRNWESTGSRFAMDPTLSMIHVTRMSIGSLSGLVGSAVAP
jgi:uncharacterized protein